MKALRNSATGPLPVNVAQVSINEHKPIFDDIVESMCSALHDLRVPFCRSDNRLRDGHLNVVVGASVFAAEALLKAVDRYRMVVYQMEPLSESGGFLPGRPGYARLLREAAAVWDYSHRNVGFLERQGVRNLSWVRPGYHPSLEKVPTNVPKAIDVLFVGALTDRRRRLLSLMEAEGLRVVGGFNLYGEARNRLIAEARVVLNVHQHENVDLLEEVRLSFLLANRCFVVSEESDWNPYGNGVVFAPYDGLVDACRRFIAAGSQERESIADIGYETIRNTPMSRQLEAALGLGEGR